MSNVGIFVDTSDLYHKVQRNFGQGSKVRFDFYLEYCEDFEIKDMVAYGMRSDSQGFSNYLKSLGFTPKFKPARIYNNGDKQIKKCDWNIMLAMDVIRSVEDNSLDTVVLGSSNGLLLPLITYIKELGVDVIIVASGIPDSLRKSVTNFVEFNETHLEEMAVTSEAAK